MSKPNYLVLTKASDSRDVEAWGVNPGNLGLAVRANGTVRHLSDWKNIPKSACPILVLNMTYEYLERYLQDEGASVERIVGASPRVWVHFGDIPCTSMDGEKLCEHWSRKEYDPFRRFTKLPMPYSQAAPADFDRHVKELSGKLKGLLGDGTRTTANLSDMNSVLDKLDLAWEMAVAKFQVEDPEREVESNRNIRAAQDLMPVFIYLDGLLYASEKAEDKLDEMAKVVRHGVPEVLGAISVEATTNRAAEIEEWRRRLSRVRELDDVGLVAQGREFCDWYRDFLKVVISESAVKDEPAQETKR